MVLNLANCNRDIDYTKIQEETACSIMKPTKDIPTRKTKGNYCLPNFLAKILKNISQRTQFESEIMSLVVILIGIMTMGVFIVFFSQQSLFVKIMTAVNVGAAFMLLSSRLASSYQQYIAYLDISGLLIKEEEK